MKKNFEFIIILLFQIVAFYGFPMLAVHTNSNGMIVIVVLATFILSLGVGGVFKNQIKHYYPILATILFIPAIYMYNSEFTFIHILCCLASSIIGVLIGEIIMKP